MPFLRVVRDKRGYETNYLIHTARDGQSQETRVLYVFRSPAGVRVGRIPFEPDVRREIEARNPGIAFNWDALVSGQQTIDASAEQRRPRRRPAGPEAPAVAPPRRPDPVPQTPRLLVPPAVEGDTPELQMRFLAHWHGLLCEHLPQRIADPERRAALMALTERLNPSGWVDADEIAAGLQSAGEALEQLSRVLAKRRRKGRRAGQRESRGSPSAPGEPPSSDPRQEAMVIEPPEEAEEHAAADAAEAEDDALPAVSSSDDPDPS